MGKELRMGLTYVPSGTVNDLFLPNRHVLTTTEIS